MDFLSEQEKAELRVRHKKEWDGKVRDRIKAVLLSGERWTPQQIAKALLISDQAVRSHVEDYKSLRKPYLGGYDEENCISIFGRFNGSRWPFCLLSEKRG
ncbi:MAG: helix-turn-helix domain-containing protein [Chlamydiia bacterium]|nr:helix-turn-helix domain-containing protein [Chlamydiia bacterium]